MHITLPTDFSMAKIVLLGLLLPGWPSESWFIIHRHHKKDIQMLLLPNDADTNTRSGCNPLRKQTGQLGQSILKGSRLVTSERDTRTQIPDVLTFPK